MKHCKIGARLIHEWATQVKHASPETWQGIFFGKRKYDQHAKKCKTCSQIKALRGKNEYGISR